MKIITNNIPRQLISFFDLPLKDQNDFDYVTDDARFEYRFVSYKGNYYDTYDTQRIDVTHVTGNASPIGYAMVVYPDDPLSYWNAVISESYFSGVLFKFVDESVICGRYFS